ncbi:MAG: hypothetical protein KJ057_00060 [Phycisphaerae bacterium]|nr:MAG: hypothetical protein F9K17_08110 [Phycisphaerae bacterium]MBE7455595.1 hypothetical protein [Planctomycetia bacterium]MCK6463232.1 hypothetical protein [Phycisphaerae bacterium]MCL4716852.1 hypothetical protein [Phycisphaerae bacterium]NUQ08469.1 hypothetical protein [Phycisphaerae bacterium]
MRRRKLWGVLLLGAAAPAALAQHEHEGDVEVGATAEGRLGAIFEQDAPSVLYPFAAFGLEGWLGDEPGFEAIEKAEENLLPLAEGCEVWLRVDALDDALRVFDGGLNEIHVGGAILLGGHDLHEHALWFIDADSPQYDADQEAWSGTFTLLDEGATGYADSAPIVIAFTPACKPGQTLTVACRGGDKIVAKLRGGRVDAELTARLDGDANTDAELHVNDRGKGRAKFKRVADGPHQVEVVECGTTDNTVCP